MVDQLSDFLRGRGFSRKRNCFYLQQDGNWGLLDFQKSRKSTADEIYFTVNLGVCSSALLEFFSPDLLARKPSIEACHWRQRLMLPERHDEWWVIRANEPVDSRIIELKEGIVRVAIPVIREHLTDEHLCREWSSGKSPGLTDIQRLMNLSVLLKAKGADVALRHTLKALAEKAMGNPAAMTVRQHLQSLQQPKAQDNGAN